MAVCWFGCWLFFFCVFEKFVGCSCFPCKMVSFTKIYVYFLWFNVMFGLIIMEKKFYYLFSQQRIFSCYCCVHTIHLNARFEWWPILYLLLRLIHFDISFSWNNEIDCEFFLPNLHLEMVMEMIHYWEHFQLECEMCHHRRQPFNAIYTLFTAIIIAVSLLQKS